MKQPRPLPPILRSTAFSVAAARQAGVPLQRMRRTDLSAPFHGARAPVEFADADVLARCRAYRTVMRPGTFFSHTTAAAIHGLPVPGSSRDGRIHVSSVLPRRAPKGKGVVGHALLAEPQLMMVRGLRVPTPAETWAELASLLCADDLVVAGDALLRRQHPLCEEAELLQVAGAATARPGIRKLREALRLVRSRTDSPMETILRLAIVRAGLPEPVVNHPITDESGLIRASGDLVFPESRVVVEYDGDHHRTDPVQWQTDLDRHFMIESLGWRVVRVNKEHMRNGAIAAVARVRSSLRSSGPNTP